MPSKEHEKNSENELMTKEVDNHDDSTSSMWSLIKRQIYAKRVKGYLSWSGVTSYIFGVPQLSGWWLLICATLQFFVPGSGLFLGYMIRSPRLMLLLKGILQFLLSFVFVGWFWSMFSGVSMLWFARTAFGKASQKVKDKISQKKKESKKKEM